SIGADASSCNRGESSAGRPTGAGRGAGSAACTPDTRTSNGRHPALAPPKSTTRGVHRSQFRPPVWRGGEEARPKRNPTGSFEAPHWRRVMVAIVAGNCLGLLNTSVGAAGGLGESVLGQGGSCAVVNVVKAI